MPHLLTTSFYKSLKIVKMKFKGDNRPEDSENVLSKKII